MNLAAFLTLVSGLGGAAPWGFAVQLDSSAAQYFGFSPIPDLAELQQLGVSELLLTTTYTLKDVRASTLRAGDETLSPRKIIDFAKLCKKHRIRLSLMPIIVLERARPQDWRGTIQPDDLDLFWRSYGRMLNALSSVAEEAGISMLVVGSELSSLTKPAYRRHWEKLIAGVRHRYKKTLAYSTNHDALDKSAPFEFVDVIGISAYFPVAKSLEATEAEMRAQWEPYRKQIIALKEQTGKRVMLMELGYPSLDGGALKPWDYLSGAPIDLEEQRRAYAAAVAMIQDTPQIEGGFFWLWLGNGGRFDRHYTPRGKPALSELLPLFKPRVLGE